MAVYQRRRRLTERAAVASLFCCCSIKAGVDETAYTWLRPHYFHFLTTLTESRSNSSEVAVEICEGLGAEHLDFLMSQSVSMSSRTSHA